MERRKSLGGLIARLVDEVAIRGKAGILRNEIAIHIQNYYSQPSNYDLQLPDHEDLRFWLPDDSPPKLDEAFLEYVSQALTCHPEIRVSGHNVSQVSALANSEVSHESAELGPVQIEPDHLAGNDGQKIRIFASEDQIWRTIAGHEPDLTRVPGLDFVCLTIIAACGPKGIPQHDLVRISGQDNRSLPMRTDRLHKSGYILKRPVEVVHNRALMHTSLLTLKLFGESSEATAAELTEAAREQQKGKRSQRRRTNADKDALVSKESHLKEVLLSEELGQMVDNDSSHDPSVAKPVAQWTPDRNIINQIFDIVSRFGLDGATSSDIFSILMGSDYKKPIEELLVKLTSAWQVSQPLHLRHLAIVKDSVQRNKNLVYVYYTFENYKTLVEAGHKTWEAISSLQHMRASSDSSHALLDQQPALDEYGFPQINPGQFEGHNNDGSLRDCLIAEDLSSESIGKEKPKRSSRKTNLIATKERTPVGTKTSKKDEVTATVGTKFNHTAVNQGSGRPRKYYTAEIPANIELWDVGKIQDFIQSRRMSLHSQKREISAKIERRIQKGDESHLVIHQLLEETDLQRKNQGKEPVPKTIVLQILHEYAGGAAAPEDDFVAFLKKILKDRNHVTASLEEDSRIGKTSKVGLEQRNETQAESSGSPQLSSMQSVGTRKRRLPKAFDDSSILPNAVIKIPRAKKSEYARNTTTQKHVRSLSASNDDFETAMETPSKRTKIAANCEEVDIVTTTPLPPNQCHSDAIGTPVPPRTSSPMHSPGKRRSLMAEKYAKTVESIPRPGQGVFISKVAQRYKRRDDPISMTTITYQMAIFRLLSLRSLDWFVDYTAPTHPVEILCDKRREQTEAGQHHATLERQNLSQGLGAQSGVRSVENVTPLTETATSNVGALAAKTTSETRITNSGAALQPSNPAMLLDQPLETASAPELDLPSTGFRDSGQTSPRAPSEPSNPREPVDVLSVFESSTKTDHARNFTAKSLSHITPMSRAASVDNGLHFRQEAQQSGNKRKDSSATGSELDPMNYVFKLPGLRNLGWFRDPSKSDCGASLALPHGQEILLQARTKHPQTENELTFNMSHDEIPAVEEASLNITSHPPIEPKDRGSGQRGGSTAILRRDVVIEIVKRCGGVFPEARAMRAPFEHEWKLRGQIGVPDRHTITKAVNLCCEQGKLRRIVFSFKGRYGLTATATVFALPEIDVGDSRIAETQEMIKQRHPQAFVPDAALPKNLIMEDIRVAKQQQTSNRAVEKQALVDEAKAMASKSQDERRVYLASLQESDRSEKEIRALSRLAERSAPKVERLISIKKPMKHFSPLQAPNVGHALDLPPGVNFNSSPDETIRPERTLNVSQLTLSQPPTNSISQPWLQGGARDNESLIQNGKAPQRVRRVAKIIAPNEENSAVISPSAQGDSPSQAPRHYVFDRSFFIQPAANQTKKHAEDNDTVVPGFMDPIHNYHRATGTFSASFSGFRVRARTSNHRGKRKYTQKTVIPLGFQSPFQLKTIKHEKSGFPGVMGSDILHAPSGTFSATFFGFQTINAQPTEAKYKRSGKRPIDLISGEDLPGLANQTMRRNIRSRGESAKNANGIDLTIDEKTSGSNMRKRRKKSMTERRPFNDEEDTPTPLMGTPVRLRRVRGPQATSTMGEDGALRLFVAVTVVRVLTGGLRRYIDWGLVAMAFLPEYDEAFIRHRWSSVLSKMRHHQVKMDADFQALFAKAYEEGIVPKIDFDHLEHYDWKWLVQWTMKHLDTPANSAPHLLADRAAFDFHYALKDDSQEKDLAHYFEFEGFSVKELRVSVINRQAFMCSLFPRSSTRSTESTAARPHDELVAVARSWIRANIITPAENYNSQLARARISKLPTSAVEAALKLLLQEKVIIEKHKNRTVSGRDYEMSDFFEKRLRTNMPPSQFYRAISFKSQLDHAFELDGRVRWNNLAHDGEVMAVLNLLANQRVKIVPIDPPLNEWGHTGDGYATRQMDKSRLNFEMDIAPTSSYVAGRPLEPLPVPPASHLQPMGKYPIGIPVWYDINDAFVPIMWKRTLAAVLGLLAVRTGATAAELQVSVRPSLDVWEVEEVLQWMIKANVADHIGGNGYALKEWWWMALG